MKEDFNSIASLILNIKNDFEEHIILHDLGTNNTLTNFELYQKVTSFAAAMRHLGVKKNTSVVIMAESSIYWVIADLAISLCGAVSVPIYVDSSDENMQYQILDSNSEFAIVYSKVLRRVEGLENIKLKKIILDEQMEHDPVVMCSTAIFNLGEMLLKKNPSIVNDMLEEINENDLYTIVYTSGSTAKPKGVELTHANMLNQFRATRKIYKLEPASDEALSFLPMAHIFERMVVLFYLRSGIKVNFVDEITNVSKYLKEIEPTVMTAVPRVLEKIYSKIRTNANESSLIKRTIANKALNEAIEDENFDMASTKHRLYNSLVYSKVRKIFGSKLHYLIVGGAPLDITLHRFFLNIGLPLYQGYGMTECSPVISANAPGQNKVGTCGKVLDGVDVQIARDGEILIKSKSVMRTYHKLESFTKKIIDKNGWLHTGDLGEIDSDGYLIVKSRKKELFKTSTGEYVRAVYIEQQLSHHESIEQVLVIADGKKFASALIFINTKGTYSTIEKFIEKVNSKLNKFESIKKYKLIKEIPTIEKGLLTPSQKLRRDEVIKYFKKEVDSMYKDMS